MKKVNLCFVFLVLGLISFGSAFQANVTIIDDIGSFTGAYLKIKSVDSSTFSSDKIYPSEFLTSVGIVKFNLEISLSEIDLNVIMIKNGQVVDDFEEGPFLINGSDILIDRREVVEVVVEESNESNNVTEVNESVLVVGNESLGDEKTSGVLTGLAMFYNKDGSFNLGYSIGGGALFLVVLVLGMILYRRKAGGGVVMGEDEKELKYMEKKVKETEKKITKIKDGRAQKDKIEKAKVKLAEEEAELKELEGGGSEKKIEEQEKVVDRAEDKVGEIEDKD